MKIKSTLILLSLVLGLISCSHNTGILGDALPAPQNTTLKSSSVSDNFHMLVRGVNNTKMKFDSAGGTLTTIVLVRKGNINLGPQTKGNIITAAKHDTIWDQVEHFNDLLNMGTGMMGDLVFLDIAPGVYDKAIVTVTNGWAAKGGIVYPVKFPGNHMTLAIKPTVTVGTHVSPDLVFNIDVDNSFVPVKGGSSYIFKPHVQVVNATTTGSLIGWVTDLLGNPVPDAFVYVYVNGLPYGVPTFDQPYVSPLGEVFDPGQYWLPYVPGGTYTAYVAKEGYQTASSQVSVLNGNFNVYNFQLESDSK